MSKKRFGTIRKFNRAILNPIMKLLAGRRGVFYSLVYHSGRRSGIDYATPVVAAKKDGSIYICLTYGTDTDWFLNVQAAGHCKLKIDGHLYFASNPEAVGKALALSAFSSSFQAKLEKATYVTQCLRLKTP
ncbi:MAG: nitroreductase [Herpetosiphonaceae bacterium]|nr:nitroreductase [Herpetosiphonaceae bacterium]